ncbi:hypothetical protein FOVSG1_004189 [Fusarium oxysporum f. sp. vasinfectum]
MTLVGCLTRVRLIDTLPEVWVSDAYHQAIRYSFIQEFVDVRVREDATAPLTQTIVSQMLDKSHHLPYLTATTVTQ